MIPRKPVSPEINIDEISSDYLPEFERVVQRVRGRYSGGATSAEQVRQQLEKLRCRFPKPKPHPSTYNLDREWRWTFPMALAWIIWRTSEKVGEYLPSYRREVRVWTDSRLYYRGIDGRLHEGESAPVLQSPQYGVLHQLREDAEADEKAHVSTEHARLELWRAMISARDGVMLADGIPDFEIKRVPIPHREFVDLTLRSGAYDAVLTAAREGGGYTEPKLDPDDLRRLWPTNSSRKISLCSAKENFRAYLTEVIKASPDNPTMTNREIKAVISATPDMSAVGRTVFEDVKREVIAELGASRWSGGGRPKTLGKKPSQ